MNTIIIKNNIALDFEYAKYGDVYIYVHQIEPDGVSHHDLTEKEMDIVFFLGFKIDSFFPDILDNTVMWGLT